MNKPKFLRLFAISRIFGKTNPGDSRSRKNGKQIFLLFHSGRFFSSRYREKEGINHFWKLSKIVKDKDGINHMDGASAFDKKSSNSSRTGSFIINNSILFLFSPIFYFFALLKNSNSIVKNGEYFRKVGCALYSISLPPYQLQRQTFSSVNERNAPRLRGKFSLDKYRDSFRLYTCQRTAARDPQKQ